MSTNLILCKGNKKIDNKYCDEFVSRQSNIWFSDIIAYFLDKVQDSCISLELYDDEKDKEIINYQILNKEKYEQLKQMIASYDLKSLSKEYRQSLFDFVNILNVIPSKIMYLS